MFLRLLLFLLCICSAFAQKAPPTQPFSVYEGCTYLPQEWNDADSFHVKMPDGKEQVLRLYLCRYTRIRELIPQASDRASGLFLDHE